MITSRAASTVSGSSSKPFKQHTKVVRHPAQPVNSNMASSFPTIEHSHLLTTAKQRINKQEMIFKMKISQDTELKSTKYSKIKPINKM